MFLIFLQVFKKQRYLNCFSQICAVDWFRISKFSSVYPIAVSKTQNSLAKLNHLVLAFLF